jgi:crotonobetainyl-CoA:carnitine CoA-transferase CaiB-like acyl-CoA transferase
MSGAPVQVMGFSAGLGEHAREVLALAGYLPDEIDNMLAEGIVGTP